MGPQEKRTINSYSSIDDYKCVRPDVLFTYIILCKMFFAYISPNDFQIDFLCIIYSLSMSEKDLILCTQFKLDFSGFLNFQNAKP